MSELSLPLSDALRPAKLCSDAQLVRRAARGDQRAFAEIFERHHQVVYRYCRSILGNEEDAADALQSTMAAVLRGLDGETREIALKPWLFRIAHNESLSLIRRRRPDSELHEDSALAAAGSPERQALQSERLRQLVDDVQALPDRQRGALVMRELSGLEYAQIGAAFGVAEGAARQAVHEARTMLHEIGEGRAMACADVRELISARDGRLLRGRKIRAHLRTCSGCEEFRAAIGQRGAALAAVAPPLPAVIGASILQGLLGGGSGGGGVAVGGASATSVSAAAGSATTAKSLAGVGLLAQGSATAGLTAKVAAVLVVGATLTGGGVVATQQLQRDSGQSPAAGASRPAADTGGARPTTQDVAAPENTVMAARRAQHQATARAVADGAPTAATAVAPRDDSVRREPAASQRPVPLTPTPARTGDARPELPAAGAPSTSPAPATAPAQRPASAQPPSQPSAAAPVTAPTPVAPVQGPAAGSVPAPAASAPGAPSVPQTPQPAPPEVPGR